MREGWEIKTLGEIASVQYGFTGKASIEGVFRYVRITDIGDNGRLIMSDKKYLDFSKEAEVFTLEDGDLLMARTGATFAKVLLYEDFEPSVFASYLIRINFHEELINKLYWYFSKSEYYWDQAKALSSGAAQPHFNGAALKRLIFKYPKSLPEQKQIVKLLDQAFEAIDQVKANIEKNIANAKELFQSKLNEVFSRKGEGWEEKKLLEVITLKSGTTLSKSLEKTEGDIPYLKVSDMNIEGNEFEITTSTKFVNAEEVKLKNVLPKGTIIFPKRGGAIATNKKRITSIPICVDLNTMGAIPGSSIYSEYLHFYFRSFDLMDIANGTTIPQINNYSFDALKIAVPNKKAMQYELVETLENFRINLNAIQKLYSQKIEDLEELKKSILQKAFSGELTNPN